MSAATMAMASLATQNTDAAARALDPTKLVKAGRSLVMVSDDENAVHHAARGLVAHLPSYACREIDMKWLVLTLGDLDALTQIVTAAIHELQSHTRKIVLYIRNVDVMFIVVSNRDKFVSCEESGQKLDELARAHSH